MAFTYLALCYGVTVPGECHSYIAASSTARRRPAAAAVPPAEDGRLTPLIRTAPRLQQEPEPALEEPEEAAQQDADMPAAGAEDSVAEEAADGSGMECAAEEDVEASSCCAEEPACSLQQGDSSAHAADTSAEEQSLGMQRLPSPTRRAQAAPVADMSRAGRESTPEDAPQPGQRCCRKLNYC